MSFLCFNPLSDVPNVTTVTPYLGLWALHPLVLASLSSSHCSSFHQLHSNPAGLFCCSNTSGLQFLLPGILSAHLFIHHFTVSLLTILILHFHSTLSTHTHLLPLQHKSLSEIIFKKKQNKTDLFSCALSAKSYPTVTPMRVRTVLYHCMFGTSINIHVCSVNLLNELVLATTSI